MMSLYQATLKKMLFLVRRPGEDITAEWDFFFFHFAKFSFLVKICNSFLQKEKKKIRWPPDWPQFRAPAGRKQTFFLRVASVLFTVVSEGSGGVKANNIAD